MSSFIRRIERQHVESQAVHPRYHRNGKITFHSNPPSRVFWNGRGSKLGVVNLNDPCRVKRANRQKALEALRQRRAL